MKTIGIVFSKPKEFVDPFSVMGVKRPVYEELAEKCLEQNIEMVIVSTKGYLGGGKFSWFYKIKKGSTELVDKEIVLDLAYDRSSSKNFPALNDGFRVVDNLDFKKFAWNKWEAYELFGEYMPKTKLIETDNVGTDWMVLKPVDGLKGKGVFIGPKRKYLIQEFVDTSAGIPGIVEGVHDLRVVVINGKIVWSHVRTPPVGEYKSNVAGGGDLKEVDLNTLPEEVKNIVQKVSDVLYNRFDNPVYSVDFGRDKSGKFYIFELNDQIGFPRPGMVNKDRFVSELIENFKLKL